MASNILLAVAVWLMCVSLVPWMMRIAPRIGALDVPSDGRRLHKRPVPRTGGIAIFVSLLPAFAVIETPHTATVRLLLGATVLLLLGIVDDVYRLSAGVKIAVQALAAAVVVSGGAGIGSLSFLGTVVEVGTLELPLSVLWLVTLINAHNMIDGLDGLCAGVSAIEGLLLFVILTGQGSYAWAGVSLAAVGAAFGFWVYNRHPASIFMGDAGSQVLGLGLGYLSLRLDQPRAGMLGAMVPLLLFGLPLSDLAFAVLRRLARGQSPFAADRGHWHHRLFDAGLSQIWTCRMLLLVCLLLGAGALGISREAWYGYAVYALLWTVVLVSVVRMRCVGAKET